MAFCQFGYADIGNILEPSRASNVQGMQCMTPGAHAGIEISLPQTRTMKGMRTIVRGNKEKSTNMERL